MGRSDSGEKSQRNWNRLTLLLIGGIPAVVMVTATWLWFYVARGDLDLVGILGTSNRGVLLQPPFEVDRLQLTQLDGTDFKYDPEQRLWTILVPTRHDCDSACEELLYLTRQIHIALGSNSVRVRRLHVSLDAPPSASSQDLITQEHPRLQSVVASRVALEELVSAADGNQEAGSWYLVDPSGWVMMAYSEDHSFKDPLTDLKFLLKNSSE